MAMMNTSVITRELFQLKEHIDQMTFKLAHVESPVKREHLKMRLEGLKRTQKNLKRLLMIMFNASTSTARQQETQSKALIVETKVPEQLQLQTEEDDEEEDERSVVSSHHQCETRARADSEATLAPRSSVGPDLVRDDKQLLAYGDADADALSGWLAAPIQRLRLLLLRHFHRYKPLQMVKAFLAMWFLSSYCVVRA